MVYGPRKSGLAAPILKRSATAGRPFRMVIPSLLLFIAAAAGIVCLTAQVFFVRRFLRRQPRMTTARPPISILKPLCGFEPALEDNLAAFAALKYPSFEVVLGVSAESDPAFPAACRAAEKWPDRFRVVLQQGSPGMNPKVNQLIGLARAARYDVLLVSDASVRVGDGYLEEIAADLEDPQVGLVTHTAAGVGEKTLGSLLDNLYMISHFAAGSVSVKELTGQDMVNGKSMAFRRADLAALGGFEAAKDYLAEDYVLGRWVGSRIHKRVFFARYTPQSFSVQRKVRDYVRRYERWAVLQKHGVGVAIFWTQLLLYPVIPATIALLLHPSLKALALWSVILAWKAVLDITKARQFRGGDFPLHAIFLVPLNDLLIGWMWFYGLRYDRVAWHGHLLEITRDTRLVPIGRTAEEPVEEAVARRDASVP
jgi:ceramide glucosyltransferase